ncbi:unnamed protein product [Sphagnum jensenii]|uniref:Uncharacterized protein n=1 Tax=Sphagnum jensenii TaxID=128206 RepID=A0ABP1ASF5_9BRYO
MALLLDGTKLPLDESRMDIRQKFDGKSNENQMNVDCDVNKTSTAPTSGAMFDNMAAGNYGRHNDGRCQHNEHHTAAHDVIAYSVVL